VTSTEIFSVLSDGEWHSGEAIAGRLAVTRSAVWKSIEQLRELGLHIEAHTNRGYRLPAPCAALSAKAIESELNAFAASRAHIEVCWQLESTNSELLGREAPSAGEYTVLLAENQLGGRGRRGRVWQARLGASLCLSLATRFEPLPRDMPSLTLVVGVCVRAALQSLGAEDVRLKWPNDLLIDDKKVGGILVELRAEAGGPAHVVIGIGLNLKLDADDRERIRNTGNEPADLASQGITTAARNTLAAVLINECVSGLELFRDAGFAPFFPTWSAADSLRDRAVTLIDGQGQRTGIARGIDESGALRFEIAPGREEVILAGELSLRPKSSAAT